MSTIDLVQDRTNGCPHQSRRTELLPPLPGVGDSLLCPPRSLPGFTMLSSFLTVLRES